jgi:drug/metabolite transporter (DMT)-like permease
LANTNPRHSHLSAYLALGVGAFSLGFSAIFVRWSDAPGVVVSLYRMLIVLVVMAWPFYRRLRARGRLPWLEVRVALLGGLIFAADLSCWATGVVMSGATNPTLLANTAPVWVGLGALVFFGERLGARFWAGLLLALAGAVVILGQDAWRAASLEWGALFGLLAGVFYGSYFLITQRGRQTLDSLTYFWLAALTSTLGLFLVSLALRYPLGGYSTRTYLSALGLGLVSQTLGYLSINYALGHLPASVVSPTLLAQPVLTALLAVVLLGENFTLWQVTGGAAVLTGVYVVHRSRA